MPVGLAFSTNVSQAEFITFETRPNGNAPRDNGRLANRYDIQGGTVGFFFDVNGNDTFDPGTDTPPFFEARSDDEDGSPQGFVSTKSGGSDRPAGGNLGDWFIRQSAGIGVLLGPFIVDYDTTVTIDALSGEIRDIDASSGNERWRVDVLNRSGEVVASRLSPLGIDRTDPSSLDSLPWTFQFTCPAAISTDIVSVRLTFVGTKTDGIGLAFNNFSAFQAVPEPGSLVLTGLGLVGLVLAGKRRRAKKA